MTEYLEGTNTFASPLSCMGVVGKVWYIPCLTILQNRTKSWLFSLGHFNYDGGKS